MKMPTRLFPERSSFIAVAVFLGCGSPFSGLGAMASVLVGSGGFKFTPAVTNINVNDQVIWTWAGSNHSTTSGTNGAAGDDNGVPTGLWDSGVDSPSHTFTNTFTSAGRFSYFCSVHFALGMTGAVIVAAANLPPTVAITNPTNAFVFSAPATITLAANALDSDGSITNLGFFEGAALLTNLIAGPYVVTVSNLAAGAFIFSAVATDNNGLSATNAVTNNVVNPVTVSLSALGREASGSFQFAYTSDVGLRYVVQCSTNLLATNWLALATNTAAAAAVTFTDLNASAAAGFYRVGRLPNP